MQVLSTTARNAALLIGLLLSFFLLMSLQVNRGSTLAAARGAVTSVTSPVQRVGASIGRFFTSTWGRYVWLVGAERENEQLRERVADLERAAAAADAARRENGRLRGLLGANAVAPGEWITARVAAREFTQRYETITIDRGRRDGIEKDAAVIGAGGALVGRVVQANLWTSTVQLLTDPLSGVGARLAQSRATGLVAGNGDAPLRLNYISTRAAVSIGETVVTSGEDGIYPPDLLIGTVTLVDIGPPVPGTPRVPLMREETALFKEIELATAVDMLSVENVLVQLPSAAREAENNAEAANDTGREQ
jgi:rod shape-determining protein MreC